MTRKIKIGLTVKIFIITALLLAVACSATFGFVAWYMPKDYVSLLDSELEKQLEEMGTEFAHMDPEESFSLLDDFAARNHIELSLLEPDGYSVIHYANKMPEPVAYDGLFISVTHMEDGADAAVAVEEDVDAAPVEETDTVAADAVEGNGVIVTSSEFPIFFKNQSEPYILIVTTQMYEVNQAVESLYRIAPWLGLVILAISLIGSFFYSGYITKPVVRISGISSKLAELDFSWRCEEKRSDEIGVLADSLNTLAERLDTALEDLRRANDELSDDIAKERERERKRLEFFAAVSHELKTPITIIKGQLEGMIGGVGSYKDRDRYLARSLQVVQGLEGMVREILTISRMESDGFVIHPEEMDFSASVREALETLRERMTERRQALHAEVEDGLAVDADPLLIRRVLDNLVTNAAKYSPEGESIYVKAKSSPDGVWFSILNTGAHIPEESLPRVYEAFYRVEKSRSRESGGSGLGLYLTKMILDLHGADYQMENTAAGVQFRFALSKTASDTLA